MTAPPQPRCGRCGARVAPGTGCAQCHPDSGAGAPIVPDQFWSGSQELRTALRERHIGRVIRAYRTHPFHGRHALPQELVATWLATTQSQLSRLEHGPRVERLDQLIHVARVLRIPAPYLWFRMPEAHSAAMAAQLNENGVGGSARLSDSDALTVDVTQELGSASTTRTARLTAELTEQLHGSLRYVPPDGPLQQVREFVASGKRVCLVTGPPGCGKSSLMHYLSRDLTDVADVQLHFTDTWDLTSGELATEILRYASTVNDADALLTLENAAAGLQRPCVVILDGLSSQARLDEMGRQLDAVLRQVATASLKFVLVVRTPPDVEMSAFPVVAASIFRPDPRDNGSSLHLTAWDEARAKQVWDISRGEGDPQFSDLPASVRSLARTPLYMRLLMTAGYGGLPDGLNTFWMVDHCVQSILRANGELPDRSTEALCDLAQREAPELIPDQLLFEGDDRKPPPPRQVSLFLRQGPRGDTFEHDVVREYFLSIRIAERVLARGRSVTAVTALNELAAGAAASAVGRGVFDFVVCRLDAVNPAMLGAVAVAPTVSVTTTLPLMTRLAASVGAAFATPEVLRVCAGRCTQDNALELARGTLAIAAVRDALAAEYFPWLVGLLRKFGAAIWDDVVACLERTLTALDERDLIGAADLSNPDEATFFARYFFLFFGDDEEFLDTLRDLWDSPDWRVRSALGDALRDERSRGNPTIAEIAARLVRDDDYKVRASLGKAIGVLHPPLALEQLPRLLHDDNWHVRASTLAGVLPDALPAFSRNPVAGAAAQLVATEPEWAGCPTQVATLVQRLLLVHGKPADSTPETSARQHALFALLRELHTGWTEAPAALRSRLIQQGHASESWLVRREAQRAAERDISPETAAHHEATQPPASVPDGVTSSEAFRRLRGGRSIQVALDLYDLDHAITVAASTVGAGVDFIEVGDPLIKQAGVGAIEAVKRQCPQAIVVAEMMSSDWGRDQVVLAAEAGADVVLLIGPATAASVAAAVHAGRRLGVPIVLDAPAPHANQRWVRDMERQGVDGFAITTNIDIGSGTSHPLASTRALRAWTRLPVAVSGGFSATDRSVAASPDWDILIVGRSITEATRPAAAAKQLHDLVHGGVL